MPQTWTTQQANDWLAKTGWLVGFNYLPATAVNSTEMWQAETFDTETMQRELALAARHGYNTCRVFLPFIVWHTQNDAFMRNLDEFLCIADANHISVMPILFDDCAFAGKEPYAGAQDAPVMGVHNSGWTPSPGSAIADNPHMEAQLAAYVLQIVGTYANDPRVVVWDIYNEVGGNDRKEAGLPLLRKAFHWAREVKPSQPLTACVWAYADYDTIAAELSDVVSFHEYSALAETEKRLAALRQYNRPLLCTEWLHRPNGNTFESHLPFFRRENIGAYHWGLVQGRTQTHLNWDTMGGTPNPNPDLWQHDVFRANHAPYHAEELAILQTMMIEQAQ